MIKSDKGDVEIVGQGKQISAEFCTLILSMLQSGIDELILDALYATAKDDFHKGKFGGELVKSQNGIGIEIDTKNLRKQMEEENERNEESKKSENK